jgi:hypothetical protein
LMPRDARKEVAAFAAQEGALSCIKSVDIDEVKVGRPTRMTNAHPRTICMFGL